MQWHCKKCGTSTSPVGKTSDGRSRVATPGRASLAVYLLPSPGPVAGLRAGPGLEVEAPAMSKPTNNIRRERVLSVLIHSLLPATEFPPWRQCRTRGQRHSLCNTHAIRLPISNRRPSIFASIYLPKTRCGQCHLRALFSFTLPGLTGIIANTQPNHYQANRFAMNCLENSLITT